MPSVRAADDTDRKVSVNLRDIPLRSAIDSLFSGTGLQYSVDPNVLNVPVTLNLRDIGLQSALRLLVRQAATAQPGLTFSKDGDIYVIKIRQPVAAAPQVQDEPPPEYTEKATEFTWEKIPIQFNNVMVFTLAFGGTMLPTEADVIQAGSGMGGNGMNGMGGGFGNSMGGGFGNSMGGGFGNGMGNGFGNGMGNGFGSGLGGSYGSGVGGGLGSTSGVGRRF